MDHLLVGRKKREKEREKGINKEDKYKNTPNLIADGLTQITQEKILKKKKEKLNIM